MKRRQYIATIGATGAGLLAGCTGTNTSDDTSSEDEDTDTTVIGDAGNDPTETHTPVETETPSEKENTEHDALGVLDSYIAAITNENLDTLADAMHPNHPFNPDTLDESEMESVSFGLSDVESYERELVDDGFGTDDIRDMPNIGFWFEKMDVTLASVLDGEEASLAEVTYETTEGGDTIEQTAQIILLTDGGDWQVFLPYEQPADIPQGDPVDDEQYRVVDSVEFDTETERATVNVSGLGDIEAEAFVVYSSSLRDSSRAFSEESETLPSLNYLASPFDPMGDEIVVTIRFEDREIVVYRESYPQEDHAALSVLDSYVTAVQNNDRDAMATYMHSYHPFNPANLTEEELAEFSIGADYEKHERKLIDAEFSTDDIREMDNIDFWFSEMDVTLAEVLDGEEAVLAELTYEVTENGTTVEKTDQIILLTDDGDWRVFLTYDERVEVPQGEPVDDEQYRVVDSVEFDTESERATVNVSGMEDIEAKEFVVYSSSLGESSEVWSDESEMLPSLTYFTAPFDPSGDEIVATIRFEDSEIVVYRETYDPETETVTQESSQSQHSR